MKSKACRVYNSNRKRREEEGQLLCRKLSAKSSLLPNRRFNTLKRMCLVIHAVNYTIALKFDKDEAGISSECNESSTKESVKH